MWDERICIYDILRVHNNFPKITPYHLFFSKTLKIDATPAIKMDMSHFEFIFSLKKKI